MSPKKRAQPRYRLGEPKDRSFNAGVEADSEPFYIIQVTDERTRKTPLTAAAPASSDLDLDMAAMRRREMKAAEKEFQKFLLTSLNEHYEAVNSKVQDLVEKQVVARLEAAQAQKDGGT